MPNSFKNFNSFIRGLTQQNRKEYIQHKVLHEWSKIVGPVIAKQSQAFSLKGPTLYVTVSDPLWMNELKLNQHKIMDKINSNYGVKLDAIHFKFGKIQVEEKQNEETTNYKEQLEKVELAHEIIVDMNADDELKESMKRLKETWEKTQHIQPTAFETPTIHKSQMSHEMDHSFLEFYYPKTGVRSFFLDFE